MINSDAQAKMPKAYKVINLISNIFAVSAPAAMIGSAVIITLYEGWWFNLFWVYVFAILMITGTLYLSVLTLMREIARNIGKKVEIISDTPITKWLHRLLMGTSLAGVITFVLLFLILCDLLNGGFAILHFICGAITVVLYLILGINSALNSKKTRSSN